MATVFEKFVSLTERRNIPFTVNFELTHRCNLRCIHCYLPSSRKNTNLRNQELTRTEIESILNQLADAGSLWLVFTGGEIFLRKDFFAIAKYARKKSFLLTIFTNATLIDSKEVLHLAELAPYQVQISLYGARPETHDYITRVKGSFARTLRAVKLLRKSRIKVVLKTALMKENFSEYREIIRLNEKLGTNWQIDPWITPKNDRDQAPLARRTLPEQMKELFSAEEFFPKEEFTAGKKERFICSAGKNLVAISPYGDIYPCLMWLDTIGNLREEKFAQIWKEYPRLESIRRIEFENLKICKSCKLIPYCIRCPGLADLEDGDVLGPSKIACQTAKIIKRRIIADKKPDVRGLKSVAI